MKKVWDVDEPRARNTDPETSHEAAASVRDRRPLYNWILARLVMLGPLTDVDLAALHLASLHREHPGPKTSPSGLRTRRKELVVRGEVEDSGERIKLPTGRYAILWRAK